jgi:surfeit locus 1 family protein
MASVVGVVILISLGVWQLQRLQWKEALLARIEEARVATPEPIETLLGRQVLGDDVAYTHVSAVCPGFAAAPFIELYAVQDGQAGSRLISACRLTEAPFGSIIVDRGFVADTISARPPVDPNAIVPVTVTGIVRYPDPKGIFTPPNNPGGRDWYWRDLPAMGAALGAETPAPVFLAAETSSNPEWAALQPSPMPTAIANNHLGYALTWFGLAAALTGVYVALLLRRLRQQDP